MEKLRLYDSTLRDGAQAAGISFSVDDKLKIAQRLDSLGIHYIEGGWPGAVPTDSEFFDRVKDLRLKRARVAAFTMTRRTRTAVEDDRNIDLVLKARAEAINVSGKAWDFQVDIALKTTKDENLHMIAETLSYIKPHIDELFFTAEHFFDGYRANPDYALKTLEVAAENGAQTIILADTNGGGLPDVVARSIAEVQKVVKVPLGIEVHNDSNLAMANGLGAVRQGVSLVEGTINGYGEKCGSLDLCAFLAVLKLKLKIDCITDDELKMLTEVSRYVSEIANLAHDEYQPFVGNSAFAHKGGLHVSAVLVNPKTYEDIVPELVGNRRRVLISELAGRSNLILKAREFGVDLEKDTPEAKEILGQIKQLEKEGYQFEGAEASFELLVKKALKTYKRPFTVIEHRVIEEGKEVVEEGKVGRRLSSEATVKLAVDEHLVHKVATGNGPVNALHNALKEALFELAPSLGVEVGYIQRLELHDYKVRIVGEGKGTASEARVLIEFTDGQKIWGTCGVSTDILEASWEALTDSYIYAIIKRKEGE